MSKSKKMMLRIVPVLLIMVVVFVAPAFGIQGFEPFENPNPQANTGTNLVGSVNKVWGVLLTILQVAAIAALVFCGVKYMFASADDKADLKKSLGGLAVGAILVFGASTVVSFLTGAFKEIAS